MDTHHMKENPAPQPEPQPTCGDRIVDYLLALGVERVFGVAGGAIEPFFDAVARAERHSPIRMTAARHETGGAFMADGYYRETGTMAVCCSTTGPGATNMITGVASAFQDNIPLLVITAQTPMFKFGNEALQDSSCAAVDIVSMYKSCTKYSTLVSNSEQLEHKLTMALSLANTTPKGPVHLSIPADLLNKPQPAPKKINPSVLQPELTISTPNGLERLSDEIAEAKRIAIHVGENCDGCGEQIRQLVETLNAAFICDPAGKRWVDETHPQFCGVIGFSGHASARKLIVNQEYDLLLTIGTKVGELGSSGWEPKLLSERMIHIDDSPHNFARTPNARLHVCGNLNDLLQRLNTQAQQMHTQGKRWSSLLKPEYTEILAPADAKLAQSASIPLKPQRLFTSLSNNLPEDARVYLDAGNAWSWGIHYLLRKDTAAHYRIAMGYGTMMWAIGASVGAALANPSAPHLCVTGDGSFLMSGQEITVAIQHNLPLVMMILNDDALGMVKHGQRMGGAEQTCFEHPHVSYAAIAQAMGIEGIVIHTPEELEALNFERLFAKQAPTIIDLRIDPEEAPPMGERVKGLTTSK